MKDIEAQVAQIVVDRVDNLLPRACVQPGTFGLAGADFGHDDQIIRIGMQCLSDDLIGYVGTIEIAGIDVVHTLGHRFA